ncbi:MAG: phospho-sugar mutase, partial [Deltaproteobacteria bacterium]|nr:phospho-sugar mutase [Deltaproteobacteria bacterium]
AYLLAQVPDAAIRGVIIGFDGRRNSRVFAEDAATVLAAMGVRVWLTDRETPTPVCAFAVTSLGTAAGVVITASHNPPEYNGYKVYWQNGAQIIPPHDQGIAAAINTAAQCELPWCDLAAAKRGGNVRLVGDDLVESYLQGVAALSRGRAKAERAGLAIAYTPLHGVGARVAEQALRRAGFTAVFTVVAQREPDPRFPSVRFPNPEEPGAMDMVLTLAREQRAALACANDPDADRLAVAVRTPAGDYRQLTGDQVGALLAHVLLASAPPRSAVATTVVSSRLLSVMARSRGVGYFETLTGFKWIANAALARQAKGERFLFGYEEALGYTIGDLVRDKDGISALVLFAELAADCAAQGETVLDRLEAIYREHGLYLTAQESLALAAHRRGPTIGERLRARPPESVGGRAVLGWTDLVAGRRVHAGRTEPVDLPPSDVLIYELDGGARVVVRPSGTEPKLKCYYEVRETLAARESFAAGETRARVQLLSLMQAHQREIAALQSG